jgi:ATP-dependent Lon protease
MPEPQILPVLPLSSTVVFPDTVASLHIGLARNIKLIEEIPSHGQLVLAPSLAPKSIDVGPETISLTGVLAKLLEITKQSSGYLQVTAEGLKRVRVKHFTETAPYLKAEIVSLEDEPGFAEEEKALVQEVLDRIETLLNLDQRYPQELERILSLNQEQPGRLADLSAYLLHFSLESKRKVLDEINVVKRLRALSALLISEIERLRVSQDLVRATKTKIETSQREYFLRQELAEIRRQLGEIDPLQRELESLQQKLEAMELPLTVKNKLLAGLERLKIIPPGMTEFGLLTSRLEWIISLPWKSSPQPACDYTATKQILDQEIFGLDKVKSQVIELLSAHLLRPDARPPALCLIGPSGTGKTYLGKTLAKALKREFVRFSVEGTSDARELKGRPGRYYGDAPGIVMRAINESGVRNPLLMIEDIDKLGQKTSIEGPVYALAEILNPEANARFVDDYLGIPYDLSQCFLVTTATNYDNIPEAISDLLEYVEFSPLTEDEKIEVVQRSILPRHCQNLGLDPEALRISEETLRLIIRFYTQEAGVRELGRQIETLCHKCATQAFSTGQKSWQINAESLEQYLGPQLYKPDRAGTRPEIGVAMGLAWTEAGGDIMPIEALKVPGSGQVFSTGSLGEVMKESIQASHSFVRSQAQVLVINPNDFFRHDVHIHFPSGGIPKDGPSAGVAVTLVLASVFSNKAIRNDLALTGEVTLRGKILPIGGVKEKILAAHRVGIKEVIIPRQNLSDLQEIPENVRSQMEFHLVENMSEVFQLTLVDYAPKKGGLEGLLLQEIEKLKNRSSRAKNKRGIQLHKRGKKKAKSRR